MPYYCTVPRCTSMAGKAKNVSFHQFPRDEDLAKLWNKVLKRGKPYTKYSKVCSLHFRPEDYTITSVGKTRGQWRSLRKDAIPSQNLPSDIPAPYHRSTRNTGSWVPNTLPPNILDPQIHQQMAQAIYMQTMLAMQAQAGATDPVPMLRNDTQTATDLTPHTSTDEDPKPTDPQRTSYKCTECTKCFKDPDVFKLHQRIHKKNCEKENVNRNENSDDTLRSNPILANLLKGGNNFDSIVGIENHIMAALAANMENYFKNMILNQCKTESKDSCDVQESRDSCNLQESRDSDVQEWRDSCSLQESRDSYVQESRDSCKESRDSCNLQESSDSCEIIDSDSETKDMEDSIDSNVLVIDEDAQKDL